MMVASRFHFRLTFLPLLFLLQMLHSQDDQFTGTFASEGDVVQFQISKSGNVYTGTLLVQGQQYTFTGQLFLGMVTGSYIYQGYEVDLVFAKIEGKYYIESEGMTLEMFRKQGGIHPNTLTEIQSLPDPGPSRPAIGRALKDPGGSFSFKAPAGWNAEEKEGSFLITKPGSSKEIYIIVSPHQHRDLKQVASETEPYFNAEENTYLTGLHKFLGDQLWVRYTGKSQGNEVTIHTLFLNSPHGGGAQLVGIVAGEDTGLEVFRELRSMAATFVYHKPAISAAASRFDKMLRGKQLLYLHTSGGFSDKWSYDLCSDGQFYYRGNSSGLSGGDSTLSYASSSNNAGTWKITSLGNNSVLNLYYRDGNVSQMTLQDNNSTESVLLNGKRYFIQPNNSCR
jgi:hypothetical protein